MFAAALRVEFLIPEARSLKAKRKVLIPLIRAVESTFPVGVAEVEFADMWQRSAIGISFVSGDAAHMDKLITTVEQYLDEHLEIDICDVRLRHMEDMT